MLLRSALGLASVLLSSAASAGIMTSGAHGLASSRAAEPVPDDAAAQYVLPADTLVDPPPMDTLTLASGPYGEATALLEKTLFRIDVARLRLRFGTETAAALEELLSGRPASDERTRTAVETAVQSRDAWAGLTFLWDTGFDRFLEGVLDGVDVARRAGLVGDVYARDLADSLVVWYEPLRERGIRDGDMMMYRIRGDTLRTLFVGADGGVLVDHTGVGPESRLSVLGGFLEPGSDFREGLLRSLLGTRGGAP